MVWDNLFAGTTRCAVSGPQGPVWRICNDNVTKVAGRSQKMGIMEFQVCQQMGDSRWIVRVDDTEYGAYLDKEQAVLDAVEAAHDAREAGRDAQVWVREQASAARIL
jgi:hypothetical protein